ncbi:MAG TPA: hypothetical protein VKG23_11845 [Thermoanaerobaculia bacterium]|nr:hypothetical protein [Thermoanaerobaculia bacterium]
MSPLQPIPVPARYRSIFTPSTETERAENFESYWVFTQRHDGEILEDRRELTRKNELLAGYQNNPVRSRKPLPDPEVFYRNYVHMKDDPSTFDRKTLLLTFLYKFARHEWVGISAAWDRIPSIAECRRTSERISRYHLCEEFTHVRLFHEMFRTFHLDRVEWVPLGKWMNRAYGIFPYFPESVMSPPAFVSELMGLTLYLHIDAVLDGIFADEPEARDRVRALLREIMTDEMAHVGQRRNFIGPVGLRASKAMVGPMFRLFYRDIPESKFLFDVDRMVREAEAFDYSTMPADVIARSWIPSYCQYVPLAGAAAPVSV